MKSHIKNLDGIRGLAILLVLLYHFCHLIELKWPLGLNFIIDMGWAGVDLFFVLSGFLITSILIEAKGSNNYFKTFYMRRFFRIFPLYYLALFIVFIFAPIVINNYGSNSSINAHQIWYWTYLGNFYSYFGHLKNEYFSVSHFWSLCIEEQFYIFWPLVIFLTPNNKIQKLTLSMIVMTFIIRAFFIFYSNARLVYHFTFTRFDLLFAGAFLASYVKQPAFSIDLRKILKYGFVFSILLLIILFWLRSASAYDSYMQLFGYPAVLIASCFIVYEGYTNQSGLIARVFSNKFLAFFGIYSYGIYVIHGLLRPTFLRFYNESMQYFSTPLYNKILFLALAISLTVGIAYLSFHLFEKRFLRLKKYFNY